MVFILVLERFSFLRHFVAVPLALNKPSQHFITNDLIRNPHVVTGAEWRKRGAFDFLTAAGTRSGGRTSCRQWSFISPSHLHTKTRTHSQIKHKPTHTHKSPLKLYGSCFPTFKVFLENVSCSLRRWYLPTWQSIWVWHESKNAKKNRTKVVSPSKDSRILWLKVLTSQMYYSKCKIDL